MAPAQTAVFPGAVVTDQQLKVVANNVQTTITFPVASTDTTIQVANSSGITANSVVTLDNENVAVCAVPDGTHLTVGQSSCPSLSGRGFDSTTVATHSATGANCNPGTASGCVSLYIDAWHHNAVRAEIEAIEGALGANLANVPKSPELTTAAYNFAAQSPGGTLAAGSDVISLNCPLGINSYSVNNAYVWLTAGTGGTAEPALITGGTCTSGSSSGTLVLTVNHTHGAGWQIQPATFGIQEAVMAACVTGGGIVTVPASTIGSVWNAKVTIPCSNIWLQGPGIQSAVPYTRTADFGDSIYVAGPVSNVRITGFYLSQTLNYSAGPPSSISNKPTSGAHIHLFACWECRVEGNALWNMPYGVDADGVGRMFIEYNEFTSIWDNANTAAQVGIAAVFLHHSVSGTYGYPTYAYVEHNEIVNFGSGSAPRTITINGNNITNHTDAVGSEYGVWIASCEVCEVTHNSIEWTNYSGVHVAAVAAHSASDALLDTLIADNYMDFNRMYGVDFDMTANTNMFALNFRVERNRIGSPGGLMTGIYFAPPATPWTYVRTAAKVSIADNQIFGMAGAGISILSGGNIDVHNNQITDYNYYNAFPTNSLSCTSSGCSGDALGSSGIYVQWPALELNITGNSIGGSYVNTSYGGIVYTVSGITLGNYSTYYPTSITAPNFNTGVQPVGSRTPPQYFDPAFVAFPPILFNGNLASMSVVTCGTLGSGSTPSAGKIASTVTGTCNVGLSFGSAVVAPNGWACTMQNLTHTGSANAMYESASSASAANFSGTTVSGDTLVYTCSPY